MDDRSRALDAARRHADAFLASLPDRPVWPRATYEEMVAAFDEDLPAAGMDPAAVVDALAEIADPGINAMPGGRFFGFVIGGTLPAALAADWLCSAWDQNAGLAQVTPSAAAVEVVVEKWIVDLLGLRHGSAVGLVTGAMMANYTCLAAARNAVLGAAGWDLAAKGMTGAPPIRFVVGERTHGTIERSAKLLGFGTDEIIRVPSDDQGRMRVDGLERVLETGPGPLIVCLQAGEVHTGAFDSFPDLVGLAQEHGGWVHVDGAFGLWAAASEATRHLTAGVGLADSWTTDGHKTLNVPYDCGFAIVANRAALGSVFGVSADYLIDAAGDPIERTPEFSRRARGFAVWAALKSLGRQGVSDLVEGLAARAAQMAEGLAQIPGVTVVAEVPFTQVMLACRDDDTTRLLGQRLLDDGTAALTPGVWRGRAVQRCSVSNWATTPDDVEATLAAVRRLAAELA